MSVTVAPVWESSEDVTQRVMERYGAAGLPPSGPVHVELDATDPERDVECYDAVDV